jgi:hypothetical protein
VRPGARTDTSIPCSSERFLANAVGHRRAERHAEPHEEIAWTHHDGTVWTRMTLSGRFPASRLRLRKGDADSVDRLEAHHGPGLMVGLNEVGQTGLVKSWSCTSCAFIPISLRRFPPLAKGGQY